MLFLLTTDEGKKNTIAVEFVISVFEATKLKASWATINIETSPLTFYIHISLELEIDLKLAERRQAFWDASPGGSVVEAFFSFLPPSFLFFIFFGWD